MAEYKSNSFKSREAAQTEKKVSPVPNVEVVQQKKPLSKRLLKIITKEDANSIWEGILKPNIQNGLYNILEQTLQSIFRVSGNGKASTVNSTTNSRASYRAFYDKQSTYPSASFSRLRDDYRSYIIKHHRDPRKPPAREQANNVLNELRRALAEYGCVSVLNYYDILGVSTEHTDANYGWYDLSGAEIVPVMEGYMIKLPKAFPID